MEQLRRLVIFLILGLTLLMNIERLDFEEQNLINISSFVYVLSAVTIIAIITLQHSIRISLSVTIFPVLALYLFLKLFIFNHNSLFDGINIYVCITEISLLTLLVVLAYRLAETLTEFEEIVHNLILPRKSSRILNIDEAKERIKTAFALSRRHEHPLSIILVEPSAESLLENRNKIIKEITSSFASHYLSKTLARNLSGVIRRPDLLIQQVDKHRLIIVCNHTDSNGLAKLLERVDSITGEHLAGVSVNCGVASFPEHAVTFEELIKHAESHLSTQTEPPLANELSSISGGN